MSQTIHGRYKLISSLGERTAVSIWSSQDIEKDRKVAVAIISPDSSEVRKRRCLEMVQPLSSLDHPNIVKIQDSGEEEGGVFCAMEMLEGDSLATRLTEEPALWLSEMMDIGGSVLEGLGVLHEKGLFHGDIEPGNIYLVPAEGRLLPKLIGLGCSRAVERGNDTLADPEDEGYLRSLLYASPEQARGELKIDSRSDLYSLGVILYQALSGLIPVHEDGGSVELRRAIIKTVPTPLHQLNEEIPITLSDLVERALQRDPDARFQSARDMQRELLAIGLKLPSAVQQKPLPIGHLEDDDLSSLFEEEGSISPESSEHQEDAPSTTDVDVEEVDAAKEEPDDADVRTFAVGDDIPDDDVEAVLGEITTGKSPDSVKRQEPVVEDAQDGSVSYWLSNGFSGAEDKVIIDGHQEKGETSLDLIIKDVLRGVTVLPSFAEKPKYWRWVVVGFVVSMIVACVLAWFVFSGGGREQNKVIASEPIVIGDVDMEHSSSTPTLGLVPRGASKGSIPTLGLIPGGASNRSENAANVVGSSTGQATGTKNSSEVGSSFARVSLVGLPKGAAIRLDGAIIEGKSIEVPLDEREHTLVVWAPGFKRWTKRVSPTADMELHVVMTPSRTKRGRQLMDRLSKKK